MLSYHFVKKSYFNRIHLPFVPETKRRERWEECRGPCRSCWSSRRPGWRCCSTSPGWRWWWPAGSTGRRWRRSRGRTWPGPATSCCTQCTLPHCHPRVVTMVRGNGGHIPEILQPLIFSHRMTQSLSFPPDPDSFEPPPPLDEDCHSWFNSTHWW